ncbi:MAG: GTP cyclohydrolase I FolE2 [Gammaproteobacteria bacterium]|nr:GTP cyclohydrolase I FolE2 [Gammaproteobacteria bacterium]MYF01533.1 GTP cyclohydrolase I FolE2 [Gammaproteobacteria bacterium]MYI76408.1 GTP cyclohydrolase I FolE2 [Gammaproteobacteria bacterium]
MEHLMPDVAMRSLAHDQGTLDWVGMNEIRLPVRIQDGAEICEVIGSVQIYVDLLDPKAKGIHMSRLYVLLDEAARSRTFSPASVQHFLKQMLDSHKDVSSRAFFEISFERPLRRAALVTENAGWGSYPAAIRGIRSTTDSIVELCFTVKYSSTCPASAALARQSIQEQFEHDFEQSSTVEPTRVKQWLGSTEGIVATPHGQRSKADITVRLSDQSEKLPLKELINRVEDALKTPVQTAVKREDEQAFAVLNGQNPMFCEDASRRLKQTLDEAPGLLDFLVRVEHFESLHAHNVVSWVAKGVPGGLQANPTRT